VCVPVLGGVMVSIFVFGLMAGDVGKTVVSSAIARGWLDGDLTLASLKFARSMTYGMTTMFTSDVRWRNDFSATT